MSVNRSDAQRVKPKLGTVEDVAERLNVSAKWVYNRTKANPVQGDGIPHFKMRNQIRFDFEDPDFIAWFERHRRNGIDKAPTSN